MSSFPPSPPPEGWPPGGFDSDPPSGGPGPGAGSPGPPPDPAPHGGSPYGQAAFGQGPYGQAPYGQAPYGPAPYGQPPYGTGPAAPHGWAYYGPQDHPQGTTILVLGVLSLVFCQLLGPVAWTMGNTALREIDANPAAYANRGSVSAGRVCGMISSIVMIAGIAVLLALLVVGALAAGSSSS